MVVAPDAEESLALDPIKLQSMLPMDGCMEKNFGELVTPTEASTSCPTSTSPSRVPSPRSKGLTGGEVEEVHVASVMVDHVLEDALKGDSAQPASPKRKAKVGKKKDEKKTPALSISVHQPAAPLSPSKRTTFGASQQGWRTPTASPQHQAMSFRSPTGDRAPLVNRCAVQWTPCTSPFEDRFAMSPDAAGLPPSPYHLERSVPCLEEACEFRPLGAEFRPPPPSHAPPPQPGPYDPQWGHGGWEGGVWDEGVVDTPNNMGASMPRFTPDCWGPTETCEPAWSPMQQMHPGCGGWGDAMPVPRKGRNALGGKKKPDKLTAFLPDTNSSRTTPKSDATLTPASARATPTAGRLPNQYSGMQFSYAVSAAPPPPPSQQYKKAATPTATPTARGTAIRDVAPRKPDLFAEVCKIMLTETCEFRLREYEAMPYSD
jgi:hypothetical protein